MADEATKVEVEVEAGPEMTKDIAEEKMAVPDAPAPEQDKAKTDESKAPDTAQKSEEPAAVQKNAWDSPDRDTILARVANEKRMSLINAWEESEKAKAENKAAKKLSNISSWEVAKKAEVEAELKRLEEELERKKAEYAEKLKNKLAMVHKSAEEKKAMVEVKRVQDMLKAEDMAGKYRSKGETPRKLFGLLRA